MNTNNEDAPFNRLRNPLTKTAAMAVAGVILLAVGSAQCAALETYLSPGAKLASAESGQIASAVRAMMVADIDNAPVNIAEALKEVPNDRARIDTILTSAARHIKGRPTAEFASASTSMDGKTVNDPKVVQPEFDSEGLDCTLVLEIWSLAVDAVPAMDQWIMEVGMREAPECFLGVVTETITETGSILRRFNTSLGLRGSQNPANSRRSTPASTASTTPSSFVPSNRDVVPSNEQ